MRTTLYCAGEELTLEYQRTGDAYHATLNGRSQHVHVLAEREHGYTLLVDGKPVTALVAHDGTRSIVFIAGERYEFLQVRAQHRRVGRGGAARFEAEIRSPMPGKILTVPVAAGDDLEDGQTVVVLEAMKMENSLTTTGTARVQAVHVAPGELVELGQLLVELEPTVAA